MALCTAGTLALQILLKEFNQPLDRPDNTYFFKILSLVMIFFSMLINIYASCLHAVMVKESKSGESVF